MICLSQDGGETVGGAYINGTVLAFFKMSVDRVSYFSQNEALKEVAKMGPIISIASSIDPSVYPAAISVNFVRDSLIKSSSHVSKLMITPTTCLPRSLFLLICSMARS
jgi:hypothetical protein